MTYSVLKGLLPLTVCENARADEDTDGQALRPHTGLDDLLRVRLVLVRHDDRTSDAHADSPAADDDLVLVVQRPVPELAHRRELLPVLLLLRLHTLDLADTRAGPCRLVVFDTTALSLDGVARDDDKDGGEGLELDGNGLERWPSAAGDDTNGDDDGEAGSDTLEGAADGGSGVGLELFLGSEL